MDKLNKNLLSELIINSRIPITRLAKKLKVSREVLTYRLNRLKKDKIILDFIAYIDTLRLGYIGAAVFISIKADKQQEFEAFLKNSSFVSWVAKLSGIWNFGFSIVGKTNGELDEKFLLIYTKFKDDIIDHRFTLHKKTTFFYEKYFNKEFKQKQRITFKQYKDKIILRELSKNSRIDSISLSKKFSLTPQAILHRIKNLERAGYIEKYSIFLDLFKLNLFQYSIFVNNKNIDEKNRLIKYLTQHKSVSFIAEYIGESFIEFGLFVDNPYRLRELLQEIEEAFPNNRMIEISLFQKEFISIGPPSCVFE